MLVMPSDRQHICHHRVFIRALNRTSSDQELKSNNYGCLATVIRGGPVWYQFVMATLIRFSIIPGHGMLVIFFL